MDVKKKSWLGACIMCTCGDVLDCCCLLHNDFCSLAYQYSFLKIFHLFLTQQVYKILVKKTAEESWVVFRRYTDFSRLNDKVSALINIRLTFQLCLIVYSATFFVVFEFFLNILLI